MESEAPVSTKSPCPQQGEERPKTSSEIEDEPLATTLQRDDKRSLDSEDASEKTPGSTGGAEGIPVIVQSSEASSTCRQVERDQVKSKVGESSKGITTGSAAQHNHEVADGNSASRCVAISSTAQRNHEVSDANSGSGGITISSAAQLAHEVSDGNSASGGSSSVISETLIEAALSSESLPCQPKQDDAQKEHKGSTVKCAGCGKVFSQPCALPQRANRVVLSLCDDCENITSAMFICINCGQECSSLAVLRAHKQTHVIPEQRIFVCEMCGVGFQRQIDLDVHKCAGVENEINKSDGRFAALQEAEVPEKQSRSRRKPRVTQKVRVEAIVKTLSKRNQQTPKNVPASNNVSPKKAQPAKRSQTSRRGRKKTIRKIPSAVIPTKATQSSKNKKLLVNFTPPPGRPRSQRKVLKIPKVFECKECSEFFTESKDLRKHRAIHRKPFPCETCKKVFRSKAHLTRHELSHSEKPSSVCDLCDKTFQSIHTLVTHKKTVHNDDKPFICDVCHKDFKQLGNMKTHRRTHTGEKPFVCKECGRAFAQMGNLQAHMVIHAASKPHVCEICGKSFSYIRSLQNHVRGTHTGERPFACGICAKTFSNPSVLRDHKRTHSDKRGYLCDKCGKGFKSYKNLKQHEKFHLDVRPYSCEVCGKGFVWFKSFQLHKRTHTGEKPYSCDQCEKVFSNINSLKNHKQKHLIGYTAPPPRNRSTTKTHHPAVSAPPPPSLPTLSNQTMIIPHPASLLQGSTRDHMVNSIHHHAEVPSSSPSSTPPIHPTIQAHSQAYGHVVFPQAFPSYVTNPAGDFTIL